jgi:hypothetical protein
VGNRLDSAPRRLVALVGGTAVVAVASVGLGGGFGQTTASRSVQLGTLKAGEVKIGFDQASTISADVTGLLPGRSTQRALILRNTSDIGVRDITVAVAITGSGASLLSSDQGIEMDVDACAGPWDTQRISSNASVNDVAVYSCPATPDRDGDGRGDGNPLIDSTRLPVATMPLASNLAAEAAIAQVDGNDMYLRITYSWPDSAVIDPASLPVSASLTWTMSAIQRAGQER